MNQIRGQGILQNTESGGIDLSLQEVDMLNYGLTLVAAINVLEFN